MDRFFYVAKAMLLGLLTAQAIATLHVYLSNAELHRTVTAITGAGYLAVPNQQVAETLKEFGPAFFGGLFFTLSVGACLSIFSVACAWIWDRILGRRKVLIIPFLLLWLAILFGVNSSGFCLMVASYFFAVPLAVFLGTLKWMPQQSGKRVWLKEFVHLLPIIILATMWTTQLDRLMFLDIRDYLLLSNPIGQKINDFYYRYTLYPAEAFKPLEQRLVKTCSLAGIQDRGIAQLLESQLLRYDYVPIDEDVPVDLEVVQADNILFFKHKGHEVLQATSKEFLARPGQVLGDFSEKIDKYPIFRQVTIFSIVIGFPLTLYVILFAILRFALQFFVRSATSSVIASILCLLIGLASFAPVCFGRVPIDDAMDLSEALESESWQQRVAALRKVQNSGEEIGNFQAYRRLMVGPYTPERYWLAKALGSSRHPKAYQDLLILLDDSNPNVVTMAFLALGRRSDIGAVEEILKRIKTSDHWYKQWYAYRTLRRLGWKQSRIE